LERGESFPHEEKTYRTIHDAREWILFQGFATTDKAGMPAKPSKGVTVRPPGYDVEDRMMVRLSDVATKAKAHGLAWVENGGVKINAPKAVPRSVAQDDAILKIIADMGLDPLKLPPFRRGAYGESSKKLICAEALKNNRLFSINSFKHSWERLTKQGKIIHPEASKTPHKRGNG
jgi:hypothetical protein